MEKTSQYKFHDKCQLALKFVQFSTISNLFSLEVEEKMQCCQLCALRKKLYGQIWKIFQWRKNSI